MNTYMDDFVKDFFAQLQANPLLDKHGIAQLKLSLCKKHHIKEVPTDIEMLIRAPHNLADAQRKQLQTKPNRSLSGVAPVAIMTSPAPCPHGKCTTCPGGLDSPWGDVPQSYTGVEPATMRAMRAEYDAYLQVFNRLEQYVVTGHVADKVDLIVMGGTFPARDAVYQDEFIMYAFKAMNDFSTEFFTPAGELKIDVFKEFFLLPGPVGDEVRTKRIQEKIRKLKGTSTLQLEQEKNETAIIRCIGLTIETRPDFALEPHAKKMLTQGCTRIELGVQSVFDAALSKINRGHTVADNKKSIQVLKDFGFKLNFHMMLGLPGVSAEEDVESIRTLFADSSYMPDMLKLYPCMVLAGTQLEKDFKAGTFTPLSTESAAEIIAASIPFVPKFCRIMRVQRDIPTYRTLGGVARTNLRQYVDKLMREQGVVSCDIRAREAGRKKPTKTPNIQTTITAYDASGGKEFFIAIEDVANDILYGFCRLRFPGAQLSSHFTDKTAIIRELHVYGAAVGIGTANQEATQHKGYGKELVATAERIAKEHEYNKILVISGVGVRKYYEKLGYSKELPYMVKLLN